MNTSTDWIVAISAIISVVISSFTLFQVYIQLKGLNTSLRNSSLMTLLELENEIISRKSIWDESNFAIRNYELELEGLKTNLKKDI